MEGLMRVGFGLFGLAVLIGITWLFSTNKRRVDWRLVGIGLLLQLVVASLVLLTPWGARVFDTLSSGFVTLLGFTTEGARFIFGDFSDPSKFGFVFAFQVLPTIIFFASFMGVLYHLGVMQKIVQGMAWVITKLMRVSGAETLSVCANAFIGQTEAPLVVRPYVSKMTPSELLTLMVGGMATIAGGVLGAFVLILGGGDPAQQAFYAKHLITASIMAAPATIVIAKILVPETLEPLTRGAVRVEVEKTTANVIDAAAAGAADGLKLALNVGAMLLAFIALIALLNGPLVWLGEVTGLQDALGRPTNLSALLGYVLAPLAWVIGVPWQDAGTVGGLIGTKVVLNEFVAYVQLGEILRGNVEGVTLSPQATLIATYALCGFANFSSIAIQIGGIGGIAPERRQDLARLGLRAVLGGSIATMMTATIAGVLTYLGS
ncbi:NupC/NupG family nucleoside CNT transporter [Luteimonas aestuarii]|uniref:NupC/NupG family nucleoside CNT transporter n=1 Tax=Luteimonas aestuarii TaxID=453837 RepID=A0A4R5U1C0_9GAMM|nr:nucleoside transporter C-terminal domain-containing protein [Luteimonas aestuarii]TDK27371.1 NupC/NupG family nucleoside CNT transporter [Luteimonas aestuarii]